MNVKVQKDITLRNKATCKHIKPRQRIASAFLLMELILIGVTR